MNDDQYVIKNNQSETQTEENEEIESDEQIDVFSEATFPSVSSSDFSTDTRLSESYGHGMLSKLSKRICCCCRLFTCRDIMTCVCSFVLCCPCVIILIILTLSVGVVTSYFTGRDTLRNKNMSQISFFHKFIDQHIRHAKVFSESIATSSVSKYLCEMENFTQERQNEMDEYLLGNVKYNDFYLHHARIILSNGTEISRIDIEHNNDAVISSTKFVVDDTKYHKQYMEGKSKTQPFAGRWKTHGPLVNGAYYDYYGDDLTGDHQLDHIEFLPLPQVMRIQKSIMCNSTFSAGYAIFNLRMVILLKEIDSTDQVNHFLIIGENGDYIFNNRHRDREFQSVLGKEQTLEKDWGSTGTYDIIKIVFEEEREMFTVGLYEFLCSVMTFSDSKYGACLIVPTSGSFVESPVPIIVSIFVIFTFLSLVICCYIFSNVVAKNKTRKYEDLVANLYPKEISRPLLKGKKIMARCESDLVVMFSDIVRFVEFNESFSNNPSVLVTVLGSMIDVIDAIGSVYRVYKVKTIGDCYFGVSGLRFKNKKLSEKKQRLANIIHIQRMIKFCCLFMRFFEEKAIVLPSKEVVPCPKWRVGISMGSCVSGIINKKTPYFDLWGRCVNLASRMEGLSKPGKIHVSAIIYETLATDEASRKMFEFYRREKTLVKGFGSCTTFFVQMKSKEVLDQSLLKIRNRILKRFNHLFVERTDDMDVFERDKSSLFELGYVKKDKGLDGLQRVPTNNGNLLSGSTSSIEEEEEELEEDSEEVEIKKVSEEQKNVVFVTTEMGERKDENYEGDKESGFSTSEEYFYESSEGSTNESSDM